MTCPESATWFASPDRIPVEALRAEVGQVVHNPLFTGLLAHVGGLLAVLNEHRQVLAVNDQVLQALDIPDAGTLLGLRPGEVLGCAHADLMPAGCGTGPYCMTCGAALAIVCCLASEKPVERLCAIAVRREDQVEEMCFQVRACPVTADGARYVLLFLQDVSAQELKSALEKTFFHDINNMVLGLSGLGELLLVLPPERRMDVAQRIEKLTHLLAREVAIQRALAQGARGEYRPTLQALDAAEVMAEMEELVRGHVSARDRRIVVEPVLPPMDLQADHPLLARVLANMLVNALEATPPGGEVRMRARVQDGAPRFEVWNGTFIPEEVQRRVFQRHFSTKGGAGRGLGTYGMKLLGERFLGGKVQFTSDPVEGTTFWVQLPG